MNPDPVKILLVDDEVRNLDVLESILHSPEHDLVRALTADEALMLLLDGEFGVIVLDIQMPGMSGFELASTIKQRKRTQHIPIIFLTAYFHEDKDVLVGYGSGAVDYLTKPINPQILRSKIAVFIELFRKTRALAASNSALELEIAQRLKAEDALRRVNNELESRVSARTADLSLANQELRASELRFKAASHAKDEFLAALSHELRTPLNPVLLIASHAAGDIGLPDEIRARFETIRRNVELEARLIDDLLDLTRITRGILRLEMRTIDAHAVVREAADIVRSEADEKGLRLILALNASEHRVRGDSVRLQQVFWNLLKNAVKFTPPGGTITLETRTRLESGEWSASIGDTGVGMTTDELGRVFEAFVQGDQAHRFGGLGLGLAISRTLMEMHSGRIEAASGGRGQGSVFRVSLPLVRVAAESAPPQAQDPRFGSGPSPLTPAASMPAHGASAKRARILLAEDHEATRTTLAHLLECRAYDVLAVDSAAAARTAVKRAHFDLIISDIGLPDAGGCELLRDLRAIQPGLPGIALSGYGMEQDVARSRLAGFAEHITKPVAIQRLDAAISAAMAGNAAGNGGS